MTQFRGPRGPGQRREPPGVGRLLGADPRTRLLVIGGAALALLLLWLLFLPPLALLRGGDGWQEAGEDALVRQAGSVPKAPEGFVLASSFYEIRSKKDVGVGPAVMTIPLGEGRAGRGLALYTWTGQTWKRLGPAEVTPDGRAAKGQVDQVPDNVVVMRRAGGGFQVIAVYPGEAALQPDAEKLIGVRSPVQLTPAADGSVNGDVAQGSDTDAVALVPVVRARGGAEAQAVNALLASEPARAAHVAALVRLVQANRLDGLDLEYTDVDPSQGANFTALVTALAEQLHRTGQTLTVTLPLPRREANNWNTLGYDWRELGRVADYIRILPERDQSAYRRTVREALNFVTGQTDPKKLILTLSPMAAETSEQGIRQLTELEALSIAAQIAVRDRDRLFTGSDVQISADNISRDVSGGAGLFWNASTATVSFVYQSGDSVRTVWIENVFSAAFKLEFVQLWQLGGVAVDDAADIVGNANLWPAIEQFRNAGNRPTLLQPNSGLLRPEWLVDGRRVEFGKAVITWKATEPGEHTVSLIVGDGVMRVINQTRITVRPGTAPPAAPTPTPTPLRR
jgi:hypothetical protein